MKLKEKVVVITGASKRRAPAGDGRGRSTRAPTLCTPPYGAGVFFASRSSTRSASATASSDSAFESARR